MTEAPTTAKSESRQTVKGGDAEHIMFNYNDITADTILKLEEVREQLNKIIQRLRMLHVEMQYLPEVADRETAKGKKSGLLIREVKTHVS